MTGRDLIVYILENHLEDEPIIKDGKFIGCMTVAEAAEKFGVGFATVHAWVITKQLESMRVIGSLYVPANVKNPMEVADNA